MFAVMDKQHLMQILSHCFILRPRTIFIHFGIFRVSAQLNVSECNGRMQLSRSQKLLSLCVPLKITLSSVAFLMVGQLPGFAYFCVSVIFSV